MAPNSNTNDATAMNKSETLNVKNWVVNNGFHKPSWPTACPPSHPKTDILSVSVGNTSLIWAVHSCDDTMDGDFHPAVTWRSPAPMDDDDDEGKANGAAAPKKFTKLSDCVPKASAVALFGSTDFTVQSATQHRFALKRIPILYVYVVSTNPSHAAYLVSLFKGFPCVLYGLSVCDFVLAKSRSIAPAVDTPEQNDTNDGISATTTTSTINVYSGIGVDRVASVVGAGNLFPKASHILLIDGGSALTYTTAAEVPSSSTTSQSDLQLGGGICPGLQMRLRALYDYSTDLPLVDHTVITELLNECTERKKPLPVFTSAPMSSSDKSSSTNENDNERIIVKSMLACITTEMALLLCCIIRKWLLIPRRQPTSVSSSTTTISDDDLHRLPTVVITGGDGVYYEKLLRRNHSYICETNDTNVELLNHGITDDDINQRGLNGITVSNKSFILQRKSYLQHYGIKDVFMKNAVSRTAENEHVETIRNQLLGLRVKLNVNQQMGTIFAVQRGKDLDGDSYIVIFDVSQKIYSLCIDHVYDSLSLYFESQYKPKTRDDRFKIGYANKLMDAKEAMDVILKNSLTVQKLVELRNPRPAEPVVPPKSAEEEEEIFAGIKRNSLEYAAVQAKKRKTSFIGKRIAKHFEIEDDQGRKVMDLFFGTVKEYVEMDSWWHVEYDDGDNEDLSDSELHTHIQLYDENKSADPKRG